ncbi:metallophosphoesterase family protein [uncultured Tateyamaria sp.]|uniref:metallophosphoesterase family protein n=1 Tax=uncultured Tateyamaria sp. TaxID=455651 RepID=UPI0026023921|nr:metallophosphoesterase family protein [uncultured Tateyamaria sp.]
MTVSFDDPIAVIADVHGNADALRAVLADIDQLGITTILNLGDHFSGPLVAAETAQLLADRDMISISGNHDRWLITQTYEDMGISDRAAHDQLGEADLDWLRGLPATRRLGDQVFMCHGTPYSDTTYWLERVLPDGTVAPNTYAAIAAAADGIDCPLILCGHTHLARVVHLEDGRMIVNPGSVGLPAYDDDQPVPHVVASGSPFARFAVVQRHARHWRARFHAVPYDTARMTAMAQKGDRPNWARAVSTGWL